jgi:hypothetical protein
MTHQLKTGEPETGELQAELAALLAEYPIYLRYGQVVELHGRLGLGGKWLVRQAIAEGRIERRRIYGVRAHYTRASVARLAERWNTEPTRREPETPESQKP